MLIVALFIRAEKWGQLKCPLTDEWIYAHTTMNSIQLKGFVICRKTKEIQ